MLAPKKLAVSESRSFPGIGPGAPTNYHIEVAPPDTNGSVGRTQYVQWVNKGFAVFDKNNGALLSGYTQNGVFTPAAVDGSALWKGFGKRCEFTNDGDPIVIYDKQADRWLMTQFSIKAGPPYAQCIAVSTSPDAMGSYYRYQFDFDKMNDYPKFGVWPDGYYATFNMFEKGTNGAFAGARLCAFDRVKMLAGQAATMQCQPLPNTIGGVLPADLDGSTPPPANSPGFFMSFGDNLLRFWKFHVDWATPANSKLTGPALIKVPAFDYFCPTETSNPPKPCIVQPKTTQRLDSLADRLMYRLAYRNFGDHESLVVNHTVKSDKHAAIRWYEIRDLQADKPTLFQSGNIAPDTSFRWLGTASMDKKGNILLGYTASDSKQYPSLRFVGRNATDTAGVMSLEEILQKGGGSQLPDGGDPLSRWGDYSSMSVDPTDDCTFWFTSQFQATTGSMNWSTVISRVRLASCQ
jgi:hypothetical protein